MGEAEEKPDEYNCCCCGGGDTQAGESTKLPVVLLLLPQTRAPIDSATMPSAGVDSRDTVVVPLDDRSGEDGSTASIGRQSAEDSEADVDDDDAVSCCRVLSESAAIATPATAGNCPRPEDAAAAATAAA